MHLALDRSGCMDRVLGTWIWGAYYVYQLTFSFGHDGTLQHQVIVIIISEKVGLQWLENLMCPTKLDLVCHV